MIGLAFEVAGALNGWAAMCDGCSVCSGVCADFGVVPDLEDSQVLYSAALMGGRLYFRAK